MDKRTALTSLLSAGLMLSACTAVGAQSWTTY
jgi:hypothetical protein